MTRKLKGTKQLFFSGGSLMGISFLSKIIDLTRGTIFLKIFSAADYGLIDIVNQIISLSKYADIGLLNNVQREYNVVATTNIEKADKDKEVSFGMDIILTIVIALVLSVVILFFDYSFKVKMGVLFGSLAFVALKGLKMIQLELTITKKFTELGLFNLANNILLNAVILLTVFWVGIYAPLIVKPLLLICILTFWWCKFQLKYTFKVSVSELKKQITYGLFFSLISLLFGSWIFFERFLITHFFSLKQVGMYAACLFLIKLGKTLIDELFRPVSIKVKESISPLNINVIYKYVLLPSLVFYLFLFLFVPLVDYLIKLLESNLLSNYPGISEIFNILAWLIPVYGVGAVSEYILFVKGVDRFKSFYILYFLKFILMGLLCILLPPNSFEQLMGYFLVVETMFFFGKQYLIYTTFFSKSKTIIFIAPLVFLHFLGLFYFQSLEQFLLK